MEGEQETKEALSSAVGGSSSQKRQREAVIY